MFSMPPADKNQLPSYASLFPTKRAAALPPRLPVVPPYDPQVRKPYENVAVRSVDLSLSKPSSNLTVPLTVEKICSKTRRSRMDLWKSATEAEEKLETIVRSATDPVQQVAFEVGRTKGFRSLRENVDISERVSSRQAKRMDEVSRVPQIAPTCLPE